MKESLSKSWTIQRKLELVALVYVLSVVANLLVSAGGVLGYLRPAFYRAAVASDARDRIDQCRAKARSLDRSRGLEPAERIQAELSQIAEEVSRGTAVVTSFADAPVEDLKDTLGLPQGGAPDVSVERFAEIDALFARVAKALEIDRRASLDRAERVQRKVIAVALFNSAFGVVLLLIGLRSVYKWLVRPVSQLRSATEEIGRGRFDVKIGLPYDDEMAVLGERIEGMAARIAAMQALLLERERTLAAMETIGQVDQALKNQLARINELVRAGVKVGAGDRDIESCHARMSETLQQLESWLLELQKSFVPDAPVFQAADVKDLIARVQQSLQPALDRHEVELEIDVGTGLSAVELDSSRFEHALVALINNAAEASEPDSPVRVIAARNPDRTHEWELAVEDEGAGMPDEVRQRLFTPFFTTKPDGNGIGLTLVKSVIEAHGGSIACHSEPGRGTRFTIAMPLHQARSDDRSRY